MNSITSTNKNAVVIILIMLINGNNKRKCWPNFVETVVLFEITLARQTGAKGTKFAH